MRRQAGVTLIELAIGLAIIGVLLAVGLPAWQSFIQNAQVRNGGESVLQGLNLARAEAIRRNTSVRFQLVSDLTSSCALSSGSLSWVVSMADPTGACDVDPSDTAAPRIIQKQSGTEGTRNVALSATGGSTVTFSGLGRATLGITQLDLRSAVGTCQHTDPTNGTIRCLRVLVGSGGQVKLCDPKVADNTDPRFCG
jgi:type IV fimbrial biogenesis protein FimT